ncbi:MAG TPA: DUF542 domain-containing protein [Gemmatimonadaceae bacterium]|nr:DUF542 domain-containing protein [Gemmatimonadaceae bacterium]
MDTTERPLDGTWTVADVLHNHPATGTVFTRFGLDTCCGGVLTVEEAAHRHGLDSVALCAALRAAIDSAP